jgi:hypothetical protein
MNHETLLFSSAPLTFGYSKESMKRFKIAARPQLSFSDFMVIEKSNNFVSEHTIDAEIELLLEPDACSPLSDADEDKSPSSLGRGLITSLPLDICLFSILLVLSDGDWRATEP